MRTPGGPHAPTPSMLDSTHVHIVIYGRVNLHSHTGYDVCVHKAPFTPCTSMLSRSRGMSGKKNELMASAPTWWRNSDDAVSLLEVLLLPPTLLRLGAGRSVASTGPMVRGSWMSTHLSSNTGKQRFRVFRQ